jgi:hypothetical protein
MESVTTEHDKNQQQANPPVEEESKVDDEQKELDLVPKSELDKVVKESISRKERIKSLESKVDQLLEQRAKEKEDYKGLYETTRQRAEELEQKYESQTNAIAWNAKNTALRSEAQAQGILPQALDDLDAISHDDLVIETTSTGRFSVLGVKEKVQRLKSEKPHWFKSTKTRINSDTPDVTDAKVQAVTMEQLNKAKVDANKSGDWSQYEKLLRSYVAQNN